MVYDKKSHSINVFDNITLLMEDNKLITREDVKFFQKELIKRIKK